MVDISVLPVISQWDGSFKVEHRHNFLRFLFVCGLTGVLLVCGLGVEDEQNSPEEVPILLHAIYVCAVGSKGGGGGGPLKKRKTLDEL
jgi:hypothetical protein